MTVIATPEGIAMARLLAIRSGLGLEIKTGMKMSRSYSPLAILQREGITNKRTKRGAYIDLDAYIVDCGGPGRALIGNESVSYTMRPVHEIVAGAVTLWRWGAELQRNTIESATPMFNKASGEWVNRIVYVRDDGKRMGIRIPMNATLGIHSTPRVSLVK